MGKIHIIFGPQGAGKTTYARRLANDSHAILFSIDEWMHQLYGPDLPKPLDFTWIMERVKRCEHRIWATASDVGRNGVDVVLDLGLMKIDSRMEFLALANERSLSSQLHFIDAPREIRKKRVLERNKEKGETFSFEVTPAMFDFMEQEFQRPTDAELSIATVSKFQ